MLEPLNIFSSDDDDDSDATVVLWTKIGFIIAAYVYSVHSRGKLVEGGSGREFVITV